MTFCILPDYDEGRVRIYTVKSSITEAAVRHQSTLSRDVRRSTVTGGGGSGAHSPGGPAAVVSVKTQAPEEETVMHFHRACLFRTTTKKPSTFRAVEALYDSAKPISTVLLITVWLPEASLIRIPRSQLQTGSAAV